MSVRKTIIKKVTDGQKAAEMILSWFEKENKPVTVQFLVDALGSSVGKGLVQKTLEDLLEKQKIRVKDFKKARVFFLNMETYQKPDSGLMDGKTETVENPAGAEDEGVSNDEKHQFVEEILKLSELIQDKQKLLAQLKKSHIVSQSKEGLPFALTEVNSLEGKPLAREHTQSDVNFFTKGENAIDDDINHILKGYQDARFFWRQRKEYVERMLEGVLGDASLISELADTFGIVTDAQAGVSFSQSAVHLPLSL